MRCPNCNSEINEHQKQCPNCGTPLHNEYNDEPTIGRGLVVFIIIGTIFLVAFGFLYYHNHKNDPEYTQTAIEPDSNLADKNVVKFDTIAKDTTSKDSVDEAKQAEKVLNSIRGKRHKRNSSHSEEQESAEEVVPVIVPSQPDGANHNPNIVPATPSVSKPHIEKIEVQ